MSDPFAAPDADEPGVAGELDVYVYLAAAWLLVTGGPLVLLAPIAPFALAFGAADDPDLAALGFVGRFILGGIEGLVIGGIGMVPVAGGIGLLMRSKWGWVTAVISFAMLLGGCCFPIGLVGFWALLREKVRKVYGLG